MRRQLLPALLSMLLLTLVLGVGYPLLVTGIAQVGFPHRADGALVDRNGTPVGSHLIGQSFVDAHGNPIPKYLQSRPSAATGANSTTTAGYDPTLSSGSNLGPSNPKLVGACLPVPATTKSGQPVLDRAGHPVNQRNPDGSLVCDPTTVPQRAQAYRALNGLRADVAVPVDAVTTSASGLDPDISIANARLQAPRVARARHRSTRQVVAVIDAHTSGRTLGFLGEKTVNVLEVNLALDRLTS
jgi:potassium-transporting ATPase KdpC subunit